MNARLKNMKNNLENMPVESNVLVNKIEVLQKQIDVIAKVIIGGFGAKNTVASRIEFAIYTTSYAHVNVTGSQKEQFTIAKKDFKGKEKDLNKLFDVKLPELEKEFEDAGGVLFNNSSSGRRHFEE